jgi:hypothetical protein
MLGWEGPIAWYDHPYRLCDDDFALSEGILVQEETFLRFHQRTYLEKIIEQPRYILVTAYAVATSIIRTVPPITASGDPEPHQLDAETTYLALSYDENVDLLLKTTESLLVHILFSASPSRNEPTGAWSSR